MIDGLLLISFYIVGTIVLLVVASAISDIWLKLASRTKGHRIMPTQL